MRRILIIEDERPAAEKLERLLRSYRPDWQVTGIIETVEHAVKWLTNNTTPDLIMMDIQLSDGICFEIFEQVKVTTPVIFTTAYDEYAIRAFKVNSIDYLLKPIDPESLEAALTKFEQMNAAPIQNQHAYETIIKLQESNWRKRFLVKVGPAYVSVLTSEVELFYISERSTFIRTYKGKNYGIDFSLDQVQQQVDPAKFFRINRNSLVNIEAISKLITYSGSRLKLVLASGFKPDNLLVSREKTGDFKRWIDG
ncbi:MAG: LytTR family DNA-binding domain-containing protein [Prolixibacteraceae bacterium]|jgi:DNA-binding LytR/AlgR family response regulator|nr:LytTR family DNA-binding domain-containing protein [Prolixibacteraceae bacterium]